MTQAIYYQDYFKPTPIVIKQEQVDAQYEFAVRFYCVIEPMLSQIKRPKLRKIECFLRHWGRRVYRCLKRNL